MISVNGCNLIGLLAKKRNGKDTVADYLVENYGFIKLSFADPVKQACKHIFSLTNEQLYGDKKEIIDHYWKKTPRELLQIVGTDMFRNNFDKHIWIKSLKKKYLDIIKNNQNANIVISDVRFLNELQSIHQLNGVVIKIIRPNIQSCDNHESENNINYIKKFDIT
jgi:dephospho-CoA kinase